MTALGVTVCIQCAMEALAAGKSPDQIRIASTFDETPTQHMRRVHPDPIATQRRREELYRIIAVSMGGAFFDPTDPHN